MIYAKIALGGDKLKVTPDEVCKKTSSFMKKIMAAVNKGDINDAVFNVYKMAHFGRQAFLVKSIYSKTVADATASADAFEYYTEVIKEAAGVVKEVINSKFGNLVNQDMMQEVVKYASEKDNLTDEDIMNHIQKMIPTPRKKKRRKHA
jgi:hypothetical protein